MLTLDPRPEPARHHQAQHPEVAQKRPPWMSKACRLIPFDKKVAGPGEAVTDRDPQKRPPRMAQCECRDYRQQSQRRPTRMQHSIASLAMLPHVKSEELVVAFEPRGHAGGSHRGICQQYTSALSVFSLK